MKEIIGYIINEKPSRYKIEGCWSDEGFNNTAYSDFYKGTDEDFKKTVTEGDCVLIALANPDARKKVTQKYSHLPIIFESYIHPSCEVSPFAHIGEGSILCPRCMGCG